MQAIWLRSLRRKFSLRRYSPKYSWILQVTNEKFANTTIMQAYLDIICPRMGFH